MSKELSLKTIDTFAKKYGKEKQVEVLNAAMAKTELADLAFVPMNAAKLRGDFSLEIKTRGITAQEKSGRCWMFAALNMMREIIAEKCNLKEFQRQRYEHYFICQ